MALLSLNLGPLTNVSATTSASAVVTPTTLSSGNSYFMFQNISQQDMYVGIGYTPTLTSGILVKANGGALEYNSLFMPTGAVNVITATTQTAQPFTCLFN